MKIKLTARQKQMCEYLLCGLTATRMAEEMGIAMSTVKNMRVDVFNLSGMDDDVELALWLHAHQTELGIKCPCKHGYHHGALIADLSPRRPPRQYTRGNVKRASLK